MTENKDAKDAVNPHIPSFISQSPWYLSSGSGLQHQKSRDKHDPSKAWYIRGVKGVAATKFRKGACKNCGAMTHTEKSCVERPRKIGAKFTGRDIKPDEVIQEVNLDYEAKRDRWNGYDSTNLFASKLHEFELTEQERRRKKKEDELNAFMTEPDPDQKRYPHSKEGETKEKETLVSDSDSDSDKEDYINPDEPLVGVKKDPKTRTTVRNLRIREDTAKYLRNLDPNSAPYDPKSRSMRDQNNSKTTEDEWTRQAGRTAYNRDAWGHDGKFDEPAATRAEGSQEAQEMAHAPPTDVTELEKKYGVQATVPSGLRVSESDTYTEFSADGFARPAAAAAVRSRYAEDVWPLNHSSVWGSWYRDGQWGYKCCHALLRSTYCVGRAGIEAAERIAQAQSVAESSRDAPSSPKEVPQSRSKRSSAPRRDLDVTEEEFEDYQRKRQRFDDPMSNFKDVS